MGEVAVVHLPLYRHAALGGLRGVVVFWVVMGGIGGGWLPGW